jgi:hypothetical protein
MNAERTGRDCCPALCALFLPGEIIGGVPGLAVDSQLKMDVFPVRKAGCAHFCDLLPLTDPLTCRTQSTLQCAYR